MQSEDDLVAKLRDTFLPTLTGEILLGVGDDCAAIQAESGNFVTSTDILVEGTHFTLDWLSPEEIAGRTFIQNVADIFAMGARPVAIVVAMVLPGSDARVDNAWLERFTTGLRDIALKHKVAVVGGDLARGKQLALSGTVYGNLDGKKPLLRTGAKVGDIVAVSGDLGVSNAGYKLLKEGAPSGKNAFQAKAIARYKVPDPPFASAFDARKIGVNSMMDVSDGLFQDAQRIAKASGVSIKLYPKAEHFFEVNAEEYYFGGEDHALLATFDAQTFLQSEQRYGFVPVGEVTALGETYIFGEEIDALEHSPWDHFTHASGARNSYV